MNHSKQKSIAAVFIAAVMAMSMATIWFLSRDDALVQYPAGYESPADYVLHLSSSYRSLIRQMEQDSSVAERIGTLDQYPDRVRYQMYRQLAQLQIRMLAARVQCRSYIMELESIAPLLSSPIEVPSSEMCSVPLPEEFRQVNDELFTDRSGDVRAGGASERD